MRTGELEAFDDLVSTAYDAAFDPDLWQVFCDKIDQVLDGAYVSIHGHDLTLNKNADVFCYTRHDDSYFESYQAHYDRLNPIVPGLLRAQVGQPLQTQDIISLGDLFRTEYYNDWMRPQENTADGGGIVLFRSDTRLLTLGAQIRLKDAEKKISPLLELLARVGPHVRRAFHVRRSLEGASLAAMLAEQRLEETGNVVILVDGDGRPIHMNRSAEAWFCEDGPLHIGSAGEVAFAEAGANIFMAAALQAIRTRSYSGLRDGRPVQISARDFAMLRVVPLPDSSFTVDRMAGPWTFTRPPVAMLTLAQPAKHGALSKFGLSPTETKLALALLEGQSLAQHAESRKVSMNTVRTQLKSIFNKMGVSRQSHLTALLASLVSR